MTTKLIKETPSWVVEYNLQTTGKTNSRVKEPPVNKEVITTSQELRMLEDVQRDLTDARFKLGFGTKFTELENKINEAIGASQREIIGAEDRRNERT